MVKKKIDIVHIYHGTQGSGGLYINEIFKALNKFNIKQDLILSFHYPFQNGRKVFFRYSDLIANKKLWKFRKFIRLFELCYGMIYSFIYILIKKPKIVNYSITSSNILDLVFLIALDKLTSSKIIITCHDVIPFGENILTINRQIFMRKWIFKFPDYFLVHNENSKKDLMNVFIIKEDKIISHIFPIMDLKILNPKKSKKNNFKYDFAILGHLRESKGLDVLLKAWVVFSKKNPDAKLLVAGNIPSNSRFINEKIGDFKNIDFRLKYLSDDDYFNFLINTKNVILPYKSGTNSGVLYNLFSLKLGIIYSDIEMFRSNPLLMESGKFQNNNAFDLCRVMQKYFSNSELIDNNNVEDYKLKFTQEVGELYNNLLMKLIIK